MLKKAYAAELEKEKRRDDVWNDKQLENDNGREL